jgi:hypothetical protein
MSGAFDLLQIATAAGAKFMVTGDRVRVMAPRPLPRDLVEELRREKPALIQLLSADAELFPAAEPAFATDWLDLFKQRRSSWELDGQRSQAEAAVLAYGDCIWRWHRQHHKPQRMSGCAACGEPLTAGDAFDIDDRVQVHFDRGFSCIRRYGIAWRSKAVAGLRTVGVEPPPGWEI